MAGRNWTERHIRELIRNYLKTVHIEGGGGGETVFSDVGMYYEIPNSTTGECVSTLIAENGTAKSWALFKNRQTTLDVTDAFESIISLKIDSGAYEKLPSYVAMYYPTGYGTTRVHQYLYYVDQQNKLIYKIPSNVFSHNIEVTPDQSSDYPAGSYQKCIFTGNSTTYLNDLLTIINNKFSNIPGIVIMTQFDNKDETANQVIDLNIYLKYLASARSGTYTYAIWT